MELERKPGIGNGQAGFQSTSDIDYSALKIRLVPQFNCAALSAKPKQDKQSGRSPQTRQTCLSRYPSFDNLKVVPGLNCAALSARSRQDKRASGADQGFSVFKASPQGTPRRYVLDSSALLEDKLWPELATNSKPLPGQEPFSLEGRQVRLISDISAAAFKQKLTKEIILWHCLRAIDNDLNHGNSHLLLETALEQLQSRFHFTESTAYRLILDAKGKVLDINASGRDRRTRIEIYGRKKIILGLGIEQITDAHFRRLKDSQFQGHGMRKAQLYEAINKPAVIKGADPKARETIEEWTGVSRLQQWRYDKLTHTRRSPNWAFFWDEAMQKYVPAKQPIFSRCKGHREMNKRNGNTYHTKQAPDGTGMLRQIARELSARKKYDSKERASLYPTSNTSQAATLERLYFHKSSALVKAILRPTRIHKEGYYLIPKGNRMIPGRQEWCYIDAN